MSDDQKAADLDFSSDREVKNYPPLEFSKAVESVSEIPEVRSVLKKSTDTSKSIAGKNEMGEDKLNFFSVGDNLANDADQTEFQRRGTGVSTEPVPPIPDVHANDDDNSLGHIVYQLEQSPSVTPIWAAAAASCLWTVLIISASQEIVQMLVSGGGLAGSTIPRGNGAMDAFLFAIPAIGIPSFFFFAIAVLVRRSQKMGIVAKAMTDLAMRLAVPESLAHRSITTLGKAIRREVASMSEGMDQAIRRAGELESHLHNELISLERSYAENETKLKSLTGDLASHRHALVVQSKEVQSSLVEVHEMVSQEITQIQAAMSEALQGTANELAHTLSFSSTDFTEKVTETTNSLMANVKRLQKNISDEISGSQDNFSYMLESSGTAMFSKLGSEFGSMQKQFSDIAQSSTHHLNSEVDTLISKLSNHSSSFSDGVVTTLGEATRCANEIGEKLMSDLNVNVEMLSDRLQTSGNQIILQIDDGGQAIQEKLGVLSSELQSTSERAVIDIGHQGEQLVGKVNSVSQEFQDVVSQRSSMLEERVTRSIGEMEKVTDRLSSSLAHDLTSMVDVLTQNFSRNLEKNSTVLGHVFGSFQDKVEEFQSGVKREQVTLVDVLNSLGSNITSVLDERSLQFSSDVGRVSDQLNKVIESGTDRIETRIVTNLDQLNHVAMRFQNSLTQHTTGLSDGMERSEQQFTEISKELADKINSIDGRLSGALNSIGKSLDSRTGEMMEEFNVGVNALHKTVSERFRSFRQAIDSGNTDINDALDQKLFKITNVLDERVSHLGTMVQVNLGSIVENLETRVNSVSDMVSGEMNAVVQTIGDRAGEATSKFVNLSGESIHHLDTLMAKAGEMLRTRIEELNHAVSDGDKALDVAISRDREQLNTQLKEFRQDLISGVAKSGHEISSEIQQVSVNAVQALAESGSAVTGDLSVVLEKTEGTIFRLSSNAKKYSDFVQSVSNGMRAFETEIEKRSNSLQEILENSTGNLDVAGRQLDAQVADMRQASENVLSEVSGLNAQVENKIQMLENCAVSMGDSQQMVGVQIDDQKKAITAISRNIQGNLDVLCEHLGLSIERIEKSFTGFEHRAKTLTDNIVRISQDASIAVEKEFEGVSSIAAQETGKARGMLGQLSKSITQEVGGIRATIKRESDLASETLRTSVHSLSSTMNSQVEHLSDQVDGLISSVRTLKDEPADSNQGGVSSHGVGKEFRIKKNDLSPSENWRDTDSDEGGVDWMTAVRSADAVRGGYKFGNRFDRDFGSRKSEGADSSSDSAQSGSFLKDTRSNLDRLPDELNDTDEVKTHLNGHFEFAIDISRATRAEAVEQLWRGFQRGDRKLFGQNLYTDQGQEMFRDVRDRYRSEPSFRNTIDRYIRDFESMLSGLTGEGDDSSVIYSRLLSPTGRAYTMLLHASGREF